MGCVENNAPLQESVQLWGQAVSWKTFSAHFLHSCIEACCIASQELKWKRQSVTHFIVSVFHWQFPWEINWPTEGFFNKSFCSLKRAKSWAVYTWYNTNWSAETPRIFCSWGNTKVLRAPWCAPVSIYLQMNNRKWQCCWHKFTHYSWQWDMKYLTHQLPSSWGTAIK